VVYLLAGDEHGDRWGKMARWTMEMAEGISAVGCAKVATGRLMVWRSIEDRGAGADAYILFFSSSRFPSLAMQVGRFWVIQCEAHLISIYN